MMDWTGDVCVLPCLDNTPASASSWQWLVVLSGNVKQATYRVMTHQELLQDGRGFTSELTHVPALSCLFHTVERAFTPRLSFSFFLAIVSDYLFSSPPHLSSDFSTGIHGVLPCFPLLGPTHKFSFLFQLLFHPLLLSLPSR